MKDISREELLTSKEYWISDIQLKLFAEVEGFMKASGMNRTQFAEFLGCSKGYVTQLLSGEFDNKISKLVELSLAIGKTPSISFIDMESVLNKDQIQFTEETEFGVSATYSSTNKVYPLFIAA